MDIVKYINDRIDGAKVKVPGKKTDMAEMLFASAVINGEIPRSDDHCLSYEEAMHIAGRGLEADDGQAIALHLSGCAECRMMVTEIISASRADDLKMSSPLCEEVFAGKKRRRIMPSLSFSFGDYIKYLPAVAAVLVFIVLAVFVVDGLFKEKDDPEKFEVKVKPDIVSIKAFEDEALLKGELMQSVSDNGSGYSCDKSRLMRAGYIFFLVQNSTGRSEYLENIVARDISVSGDDHLQNAIAFGERDYGRIISSVEGLGKKNLIHFNNGYILAYLAYRHIAGMSSGAGEDAAESRDLDDYDAVDDFIDDYDDNIKKTDFSVRIRKPVLGLYLK